jgi:Tol biopolymer transport system component/serine/threonine protein kinase
MVGQTISHYRVLRKLGGGGMGDVYEAKDLNLGRHVALKVLPPVRSRNPQALLRFEREARAASALNHPHICTIHDIGEHDGQRFIVMELLDGESVRDRLHKGPIELPRLFDLGVQIADGLDAAHRAGIVHRDVTPANIFITRRGDAKILDFGLAKLAPTYRPAFADGTESGDSSTAETHEDVQTSPGAAVGTVAYMSPEQACGDELDHRTDLFSFGAVLYEMATGQRPFPGKTSALIFDGILHGAPVPPLELNPELPGELQHIIDKALEKDRRLRYQSAADFKSDLERLRRVSGSDQVAVWIPPPPRPRPPLPWPLGRLSAKRASALLVILAGIVATAVGLLWREPTMPTFTSRQLTFAAGWEADPAISPDGEVVAYVSNERSDSDIFLMDVRGASEPRRLTAKTGPKHGLTWSPDGRRLAFVWEQPGLRPGVWWVPRDGDKEPTILQEDAEDPAISPDGREIAFVRTGSSGDRQILVASLSPGGTVAEPRPLTTGLDDGLWDHREPAWSPDGKQICYRAHDSLWVIPVNGGRARPIAETVIGVERPVWSRDGRFIYFTSAHEQGLRALWRVRISGGDPERVTHGVNPERHASLSADGRKLVFSTNSHGQELVVRNLETWDETVVVPEVSSKTCPVFAPDGSIYFISDRGGKPELWVQPVPAGGVSKGTRQLTDQQVEVSHPTVSPDGKWVAYYRVDEQANRDIWTISTKGGAPVRFTDHPKKDYHPAWSPDGTKLAFCSDRTGGLHIWVAGVSEGKPVGEPRQITKGSATDQDQAPAWSPDGAFIAYITQGLDRDWDVKIVRADGQGRPVPVTSTGAARRVHWDKRSGLLFVSGLFDKPFVSLLKVDPVDSRASPVDLKILFGENTDLIDFDLSNDGRLLVYSRDVITRSGDIWVLEALRRPF